MEEAVSKFVEGLEAQERSGFDDTQRLLTGLPVPVTRAIRLMTHAQAIEAQFLPNMTEEEQKRFTPSELLLYKHALEYKWTAEELEKLIALVRNPDFDSKDVDPDLHKRMEKAVLEKLIALVRNPDFDSKDVDPDLHKRMKKAVLDNSSYDLYISVYDRIY
jgi:preprotein translocase subunit SecA